MFIFLELESYLSMFTTFIFYCSFYLLLLLEVGFGLQVYLQEFSRKSMLQWELNYHCNHSWMYEESSTTSLLPWFQEQRSIQALPAGSKRSLHQQPVVTHLGRSVPHRSISCTILLHVTLALDG